MAIRWEWNNKIGEAVIQQEVEGETKEFTKNIYEGNCFMIFLNEWEENDNHLYSLYTFFADERHAKRCLGIDKDYDSENMLNNQYGKLVKLRLNKKKCRTAQIKKIVGIFLQAFDNLEFEIYTEEKEK